MAQALPSFFNIFARPEKREDTPDDEEEESFDVVPLESTKGILVRSFLRDGISAINFDDYYCSHLPSDIASLCQKYLEMEHIHHLDPRKVPIFNSFRLDYIADDSDCDSDGEDSSDIVVILSAMDHPSS